MKVGVENHWRLNGTKMLTNFKSHRFDLVIFATRLEPAKTHGEIFISEMQAFFLAVLPYFAKIFWEICVDKYKEFDETKDEGASELGKPMVHATCRST